MPYSTSTTGMDQSQRKANHTSRKDRAPAAPPDIQFLLIPNRPTSLLRVGAEDSGEPPDITSPHDGAETSQQHCQRRREGALCRATDWLAHTYNSYIINGRFTNHLQGSAGIAKRELWRAADNTSSFLLLLNSRRGREAAVRAKLPHEPASDLLPLCFRRRSACSWSLWSPESSRRAFSPEPAISPHQRDTLRNSPELAPPPNLHLARTVFHVIRAKVALTSDTVL